MREGTCCLSAVLPVWLVGVCHHACVAPASPLRPATLTLAPERLTAAALARPAPCTDTSSMIEPTHFDLFESSPSRIPAGDDLTHKLRALALDESAALAPAPTLARVPAPRARPAGPPGAAPAPAAPGARAVAPVDLGASRASGGATNAGDDRADDDDSDDEQSAKAQEAKARRKARRVRELQDWLPQGRRPELFATADKGRRSRATTSHLAARDDKGPQAHSARDERPSARVGLREGKDKKPAPVATKKRAASPQQAVAADEVATGAAAAQPTSNDDDYKPPAATLVEEAGGFKLHLNPGNKTGYLGVYRCASTTNPFEARATIQGKNTQVGCYPSAVDAAVAVAKRLAAAQASPAPAAKPTAPSSRSTFVALTSAPAPAQAAPADELTRLKLPLEAMPAEEDDAATDADDAANDADGAATDMEGVTTDTQDADAADFEDVGGNDAEGGSDAMHGNNATDALDLGARAEDTPAERDATVPFAEDQRPPSVRILDNLRTLRAASIAHSLASAEELQSSTELQLAIAQTRSSPLPASPVLACTAVAACTRLPSAAVQLQAACFGSPSQLPPVAPPIAMAIDEAEGAGGIDFEGIDGFVDDEAIVSEVECEVVPNMPGTVGSQRPTPIGVCDDRDEYGEVVAGSARWLDADAPAAMDLEEALCVREYEGTLRFELVSNDGSAGGMSGCTLGLLAKLFSEQLPAMTMEYIVHKCLDPSHVALACISNGQIVAGALYRPHPAVPAPTAAAALGARGSSDEAPASSELSTLDGLGAAFAELVFFAVDKAQQVCGLGTRLMNWLKTELLRQALARILVYADNLAIAFFLAQGFSHEVRLPAEVYEPRIGSYNESTLMECTLDPTIPYSRLPLMVRTARAAVLHPWPQVEPPTTHNTKARPPAGAGAPRTMRPLRLGARLEEAIASSGRELADQHCLDTECGAASGARLKPVAVGAQTLHRDDARSAQLAVALAAHLAADNVSRIDTRRLVAADERRAMRFYSDIPQVVADAHRYGLAPLLLTEGSLLRGALQPPAGGDMQA